mmetsp:Transcript_1147/g.4016  ORF Transcript_1147/g.4016 Transcript_1147/m.4016 type:complete len:231 (-) Transcript_1147:133-825(-)
MADSGKGGAVVKPAGERGSDAGPGVIFVLQKASLEVAKVGKSYVLLNCDDHPNFIRKAKKEPSAYRPDICHQALLTILDSPLNKAGKVRAVYVQTEGGVLIHISPHTRLPRTFKRFSGLMVHLLQKLSIRATNGPAKLLKVVKLPVTRHLPADATKVGFSFTSETTRHMYELIRGLDETRPVVFCLGAMAHGKIDTEWVDECVSISHYPLSAACAISRICNSLELKWNIL